MDVETQPAGFEEPGKQMGDYVYNDLVKEWDATASVDGVENRIDAFNHRVQEYIGRCIQDNIPTSAIEPMARKEADAITIRYRIRNGSREAMIEQDERFLEEGNRRDANEGILREIITSDFTFEVPPQPDWIVPNWLQAGELHLLTGPGGEGKSRLAIQLCHAITASKASGNDGTWLWDRQYHLPNACAAVAPHQGYDMKVNDHHIEGRVLYVFLEDGKHKFARRMLSLNPALNSSSGADAVWRSHYGGRFDVMFGRGGGPLWSVPRGEHAATNSSDWTAFGKAVIKRAIGCHRPDKEAVSLMVIDTSAYAYADNENDRAAVSAFTSAFGYFCERYNIALLIIAHPPKTGADYSGSTSWQGNVRGLWSLKRLVERGMAKGGPDIITEPHLELLKSSEGTTRYGSFFIHSDYNCPMYASQNSGNQPSESDAPSTASIPRNNRDANSTPTAPPASADDDKLSLADWGLEYLDD